MSAACFPQQPAPEKDNNKGSVSLSPASSHVVHALLSVNLVYMLTCSNQLPFSMRTNMLEPVERVRLHCFSTLCALLQAVISIAFTVDSALQMKCGTMYRWRYYVKSRIKKSEQLFIVLIRSYCISPLKPIAVVCYIWAIITVTSCFTKQ